MKKLFYYYKPNLRWKRTMHTSSLRKTLRKKYKVPRYFTVPDSQIALAQASVNVPLTTVNESPPSERYDKTKKIFSYLTLNNDLQNPTHYFSIGSTRASRIRSQIYKDVLEHWYYSPFNRLFVKLDIDAFLRRQPRSHFLTKKEEMLLHVRRFLLSSYYDTLRWYTYMQHYKSFKTQLGGGTKSFASRMYNQQFYGTFKKVRHLFSITPSFSENLLNVLKFDQPLFNEYPNNKNISIIKDSLIHEELLSYPHMNKKYPSLDQGPQDLINQSTSIVGAYLKEVTPKRQQYIQQLLKEKNYKDLTSFLFSGQKMRGNRPTTNESTFLIQEKNYLLSPLEKTKLHNLLQQEFNHIDKGISSRFKDSDMTSASIKFLKMYNDSIYDEEEIDDYLTLAIEIQQEKNQLAREIMYERLERVKKRFFRLLTYKEPLTIKPSVTLLNLPKTAIQRALFDVLILHEDKALNKIRHRRQIAKKVKYLDVSSYFPSKLVEAKTNETSKKRKKLLGDQKTLPNPTPDDKRAYKQVDISHWELQTLEIPFLTKLTYLKFPYLRNKKESVEIPYYDGPLDKTLDFYQNQKLKKILPKSPVLIKHNSIDKFNKSIELVIESKESQFLVKSKAKLYDKMIYLIHKIKTQRLVKAMVLSSKNIRTFLKSNLAKVFAKREKTPIFWKQKDLMYDEESDSLDTFEELYDSPSTNEVPLTTVNEPTPQSQAQEPSQLQDSSPETTPRL